MTPLIPGLVLALALGDDPTPSRSSPPGPEAACLLSLPEAIRAGLDNSETVRVIVLKVSGVGMAGPAGFGVLRTGRQPPLGRLNTLSVARAGDYLLADATPRAPVGPNDAEVDVARLDRETSVWPFKADVMARVRAIEQAYWAMWSAQIAVECHDHAVRRAEGLLGREKAASEVGHGVPADIAEAEQQVENLELALAAARSGLGAAQGQLRQVLGLPAADHRPIVLDTAPSGANVVPDWATSRDQMLALRPDIALRREQLATADLQAALRDLDDEGRAREGQEHVRQLEHLRTLIQQASDALARSIREVEAGLQQLRAAQQLELAAKKRLDAQQAFHDEGRITIDRMIDAITQHAHAFAREAQSRASYQTAIAAFEEARGTLLASDGVRIAARPSAREASRQAGHGQFRVPIEGTHPPGPVRRPPGDTP